MLERKTLKNKLLLFSKYKMEKNLLLLTAFILMCGANAQLACNLGYSIQHVVGGLINMTSTTTCLTGQVCSRLEGTIRDNFGNLKRI